MKKLLALTTVALALLLGGFASTTFQTASPITQVQAAETDPLPDFDEPHAVFHYHRNDGNYNIYSLWLWDSTQDGVLYSFTNNDEYGKYLYVPLSDFGDGTQMYFIIRHTSGWSFQTPDTNIEYSDFVFDEATNAYHFYLLNGLTRVYPSAEAAFANQVFSSSFTSKTQVKVETNNKPVTYVLKNGTEVIKSGATGAVYSTTLYTWSFTSNLGSAYVPDFAQGYSVEVVFEADPPVTTGVGLDGLFDDSYFIESMTYDGDDLGVSYTPSKSIFKAWAPTANSLKLRIYDSGTPVAINATLGNDTFAPYDFVKGEKGVWSVEVSGDLHGKYYTFVVDNVNGVTELTDPYAKAVGINGIRGMIVDFDQTNPFGWDDISFEYKDETQIIPYELHVADLTADETWTGSEANRKKFLGLIESGTTYTKGGVTVSTGFDHIKELGVNALQIVPFYDQSNDERNPSFNWGYNPQNYNALEGSYSSDAYDGLVRIREFKQVVKAYANEDIRIIMDVVYNHVASISAHSFSKLVPGYYFRYNNGAPDNSSGVGNVTASERIMMENYMVDSTSFWVSEYKISGFRFDLMGLHTVNSMNSVTEKLKTIRDDIFVIGEAWNMDSKRSAALAHQTNIHKTPDAGAFNDQIREAVSPNDRSKGWVQMAPDTLASAVVVKNKIKNGMLGKIYGTQSSPTQTVNYVACHDNNTLYDKIFSAGNSTFNDLNRLAAQSLQADSMVLLSQGISFLHAGSEILRSKPLEDGSGFDHNSYQSSYEVNSLKWDEKITNLSVFDNYKELIKIKRDVPAFQYTTATDIANHVTFNYGSEIGFSDNTIKITATDENDTYTIFIFGVGTKLRVQDLTGQYVVLDTSGTLARGTLISGEVTMSSNSTLIVKNNEVIIPDPDTSEPTSGPGGGSKTTWIIVGSSAGVAIPGVGLLVFLLKKKKVRL